MSPLVCVEDYENAAKEIIPRKALDYYRSGAGEELSLKLNKEAFKRLRIRPRFLKDISHIDLKCNILGLELNMPIGIAPTAMQKMAHIEGEIANARAAGKAGCLFTLSTLSTSSLEEVASGAPKTNKWFQLYIYKDRSLTESMVRRAEKAGYKALVLTIDAQIFGSRRADLRNKFSLPANLGLANFTGFLSEDVVSKGGGSGINEYVSQQFDRTITWDDVDYLVRLTKLPVIAKGVLTKEDALLAVQHKCKGIIVSNHGGRQIDSVPATIEVLPEIVKAVGDKIVVMMDGGVSQGTDVFKALSLGAKMVFMGRPAIWGLAVGGEKGVEDVIEIVRKDLELTMALTGCVKVADVTGEMVVHESFYAKL